MSSSSDWSSFPSLLSSSLLTLGVPASLRTSIEALLDIVFDEFGLELLADTFEEAFDVAEVGLDLFWSELSDLAVDGRDPALERADSGLEKLSEYLEAWEMVLVPVAFSSLSEDFDDEGREPVFDKAVDLADLADSCLDSDLESISGAVWDLAELDLVLGFDVAETGLEPLLD